MTKDRAKEDEEQHESQHERRKQNIRAAAEQEAPPQCADVERKGLADAEVLVEHRVQYRDIEIPLERLRHHRGTRGAERLQGEKILVDEHDEEVLLAQDAIGDVVRSELVLDDAEPRGPLQLHQLDDDLIPRNDLQIRIF